MQESLPRLTLCLAIDLKGSTASGLRLSTKRLDRFNMALVGQLNPHLEAMELDHAVVKFTGDGWLVMSDQQEDSHRLCCLGLVMAANFQKEIAAEAGVPVSSVPAMRLAVCGGRDICVTLRGGQRDFVGSSVRRAVRATQFCEDNELLIDDTVRTWVNHDFITHRVDLDDRLMKLPLSKFEEEFPLYALDSLLPETAEDVDAPVYFVRTLALTDAGNGGGFANRVSDNLLAAASGFGRDPSALLSRWNALLTSHVDDATANELLNDMRAAGIRPDAQTYNALIERSRDYRGESRWLQAMTQEGIRPDVVTLNTLLRKSRNVSQIERRLTKMISAGVRPDATSLYILVDQSEDFPSALEFVERFEEMGLAPDIATMERLIEKAPDFDSARTWLEAILAGGNIPSDNGYLALFGHDLSAWTGEELLRWYLALPHHPVQPMKRAIADYRKKGRIEDALRLSLDYPYTESAIKTIRQFPEQALRYFRYVLDTDPNHANGAYAMGMALFQMKRIADALPYLRKAHQLAAPGTRKDELARTILVVEGMTEDPMVGV